MTCKDCLDYSRCLRKGDPDALNLTDGVEICRGFAPTETCRMLIDYIGEYVYKICPKCNSKHNGSCENCAWSCALFSNGCTVFGLWSDGQYPPEQCTIVPFYVNWNSIPTVAKELGKKCFFNRAEAEAALLVANEKG